MKLNKKSVSPTHRVLLFGPPKSGKTQLAGELSEKFNLYWFDLENGYDTLIKFPEDWKSRVELISLPDTRTYPIAIETMLKVIKGGAHEICEEHGKVSCLLCKKESKPTVTINLDSLGPNDIVVVDSLTQLTNSAIANITKSQPDDYKLDWDDWGKLGVLLDKFLSHVQQAKYNIVCISHETEASMEDGKDKLVPVAGTRNFSRNSAKYFDEVIYCEVKNGRHVFGSSTVYANKILTGSRTGLVLEKESKPSLIPLFSNAVTPPPQVAPTSAQTAVKNLSSLIKK